MSNGLTQDEHNRQSGAKARIVDEEVNDFLYAVNPIIGQRHKNIIGK